MLKINKESKKVKFKLYRFRMNNKQSNKRKTKMINNNNRM